MAGTQMKPEDFMAAAINNGPFAVLVAILTLVAANWDSVPQDLLVALLPMVPWLIVVLVLMWLIVWFVRTHREERAELVKSLSKGTDVIKQNAEASVELRSMIGEMRDDLRRYRSEVINNGQAQTN